MFGMLFEMLNEDATGMAPFDVIVTPSATAIAQVRTKPVMRDTSVETDMVAVERAIDGAAMGASGWVGLYVSAAHSTGRQHEARNFGGVAISSGILRVGHLELPGRASAPRPPDPSPAPAR